MAYSYLVSIIVPVYNVERYLPACLDSLWGQTYSDLEIILVDDGSTDGSGRICDEYARRDSRIRVRHQVNAGAANAKNAGLELASGDYIAFMDSDDWAEPDWIETLLRAARTENADVVESNFFMDYASGAEYGNDPSQWRPQALETEAYLREYPSRWTCALFWNKLFKSELLKEVRFHRERRCVDDEFFTYKAVTGAKKVLRIEDALYHYRQRRSSVTQLKETLLQRTIDDIDLLAERHQWMKLHYPGLAMEYLRRDVSTLLYFAKEFPFNTEAISSFRKSSHYYFRECLRQFPGRVTLYYAWKVLTYRNKAFREKPLRERAAQDLDMFFP